MATKIDERLVLKPEEAGKLLNLGRSASYLAIKRGEIPYIKIGRKILVPRAALEKMLMEASQGGQGQGQNGS